MVKNSRILIVEDEQSISDLIQMVLEADGFENVRICPDGINALNLMEQWVPDVVLLDVMLPGIDGFGVCQKIKSNPILNNVKVIMLTARKLEDDVLKGFELGAIDYITKPFSNKILLARIKAHLSAVAVEDNKQEEFKYKDFYMNCVTQVVKLGENIVNLTYSEFEIMKLLVQNVGRVYSRSQLLNVLRGDDGFDIAERAIDVQIVNLRRKLGTFGTNIVTVRGVGYKLDENS